MSTFEGTGVAIITPFQEDLTIDFNAFEKVINHTIDGGVDYIVALGTTGETSTMNKEEKKKVISFCKEKINGRLPLVVGAGGYDTREVVDYVKSLDVNGIDAILSVAPYYNKPTQAGLFEHFKAIAQASKVPVILYNVPSRTSSNIAAETVLNLAKTCKNIVAIKEASGNFSQIMQIIKNKPEGFLVLSGDDALALPMISIGAKGVISVIANSHPKEFSSLINFALKGDFASAAKIQCRVIDYIEALFTEASPCGVKSAMEIMGICKKYVRLPLVPVSDNHYTKLKKLLSEI